MAASTEHYFQIDVEELFARLQQSGTSDVTGQACIFRIPPDLKKLDENAYVPTLFGLGPYHHHLHSVSSSAQPSSLLLPSHRVEALRRAVRRRISLINLQEGSRECVEECIDELRLLVSESETELKQCYDQEFEFCADAFIVDALFLLEVGICFHFQESRDRLYPCFDYRRMESILGISIIKDVCKLENQIPLSLLLKLLRWQGFEDKDQIVRILWFFVRRVLLFQDFGTTDLLSTPKAILFDDKEPPCHLLDWMYRLFVDYIRNRLSLFSVSGSSREGLRSSQGKEWNGKSESTHGMEWKGISESSHGMGRHTYTLPRAADLLLAGISVTASDGPWFEEKWLNLKGVLHLPRLQLEDPTVVILRNVMAFEECLSHRCDQQLYFNRYIRIMTDLIHKESDAALLVQKGVICSYLESNQQIADIFNALGASITVPVVPEIDDICIKVRHHFRRSLAVLVQEFVHRNIARPWHLCATIAATIILICTVIQTIYAPKKG